MKNKFLRIVAFVMTLMMFVSVLPLTAFAATFAKSTTDLILDTIEKQYSTSLKDKISEMLYLSDYSDFVNNSETLRSYATIGNQKSWPISNADNYRSWVNDRGEKVDWGWGAAGCMAYAYFFEYSVYGTRGTSTPEKDRITLANTDESAAELETFLDAYAQPGEQLRINNKHSVIYLCSDTTGFYIAEYWGGASKNDAGTWYFSASNDQYYLRHYTYKEFAKKYTGRSIFMYDAYETSDFAKESSSTNPPASQKTRDIVLVLDISGSMGGTKIANTKTAAKNFVTQILDASNQTNIAIVTYDTNAKIVKELSNDKAALCTAIDNITLGGVTNIYDGLVKADSILAASTAAKKGIVVMTDGAANEGTTSTAGVKTVAEGYGVYFTAYGAAIYDLAQDYVTNKGYTIYSLGFGISGTASDLMKHIASFDANGSRYFWAVDNTNVNDIVFTFEDIAGTIATKKSIVITIECPVEVSVSRAGETLDKTNTATSFGKVVVTEIAENDYKYVFTLESHDDYDIVVKGLADGTMTFTMQYITGDTTDTRIFQNVPITAATVIKTSSTDDRADFGLFIDSNNDGIIDEGWAATVDETVSAPNGDVLVQLYPEEEYEYTDEEEPTEDDSSSFDAEYLGMVFRSNHVITASAGDGGKISPEGRFMMNYFGKKTYTFTPDEGYEVEDVLIDGKSVGAVETYTFKNITEDHTIKVIFGETD